MEWLEKSNSHSVSQFDGDVIVNITKYPGKSKKVSFSFRKNCFQKIIGNEEYVVLAKDGVKIYFKESNKSQGFKLSKSGAFSRSFSILYSKMPLHNDNIGEYRLEYEPQTGLHYICLNRKLEHSDISWETR